MNPRLVFKGSHPLDAVKKFASPRGLRPRVRPGITRRRFPTDRALDAACAPPCISHLVMCGIAYVVTPSGLRGRPRSRRWGRSRSPPLSTSPPTRTACRTRSNRMELEP